MSKLFNLLISAPSPSGRRSFVAGIALLASVVALSTAVLATAVLAQGTIDEVPIDKLMAPDELSELSLGNKDAKVTIVEYMSMSCPACAIFHKTTLPELKKKYINTGKVRVVMREFPLNNLAAAGAMLARCAGEDEKDEDGKSEAKSIAMIDVLFEKQKDWVSGNALDELFKIAKQAGFTQDRFEECLQDDDLLGKLSRRRDKADQEFGVSATPYFFINGKRLRGKSFSVEAFEKVIEPLLNDS
ncbi:MAG: thioredoxin domain-containing protein [Pseudomonadota bacterium]